MVHVVIVWVEKMKRVISVFLLLISIFLFTSCSQPTDSGKLKVVTTIFPVYDMAHYIGEDLVELSMMVAPGQDIHSYDPSADDIINAKKCDVLLYIGDAMESWVKDLQIEDNYDQYVVALSKDERISLESLDHHFEDEEHEDHEHHHDHDVDMHIWTNPKYAIYMVEQIRDAFVTMDPVNAKKYEANALRYINELINITNSIEEIVSKAKRKTLYFGSPFAFYYFVREFGLEHFSIYDTCSIEVEPTIEKIIKMNTELKQYNVPVLYTKELLNDSIAKKVIEDTNAEICLLHSGHNVSIDDFNEGITFLKIWENNLVALERGLL